MGQLGAGGLRHQAGDDFLILPLYGVIIFGGNFKRNLRDSLGGTATDPGIPPAQTSAGHQSDPPSR